MLQPALGMALLYVWRKTWRAQRACLALKWNIRAIIVMSGGRLFGGGGGVFLPVVCFCLSVPWWSLMEIIFHHPKHWSHKLVFTCGLKMVCLECIFEIIETSNNNTNNTFHFIIYCIALCFITFHVILSHCIVVQEVFFQIIMCFIGLCFSNSLHWSYTSANTFLLRVE